MKTILQLIESELHNRAVLKIESFKKQVAAEAFDVPELREEDEAECCKCSKCGEKEVAAKGDVCQDCNSVTEEGAKEVQMKNVQSKRHSVATNIGGSEEK